MSTPSRAKVFISYSHLDEVWLRRFTDMLAPAIDGEMLDLWSDERIEAGAQWQREIEDALAQAQVALLLVSANFLASAFVRQKELPRILELERTRGMSLHWVPVSSSMVDFTQIIKRQASWPPAQPLDGLSESERSRAIRQICIDLCSKLGQASRVNPQERDRIRDAAQRMLPDAALGNVIASGHACVVFSAARDGKLPAAVKVLVDSPLREQASEEVARQAQVAQRLTHPAFIKLYSVQLQERPYALTMEYVRALDCTVAQDSCRIDGPAPTLDLLIETEGRFSVDRVAKVLRQLSEALAEAAVAGFVYGVLNPSDVMMQDEVTPRISAFGFLAFIARDNDLAGNFVVNREALSYMTPEHFYGEEITSQTDQYALGLLALEMLEGRRRVTVRRPADFALKERFFDDPLPERPDWEHAHPGLSQVVRRMLAKRAGDRWPSLAEVGRRLAKLEAAAVVTAKNSYRQCCSGKTELWAAFYARLFELCPEAKAMFGAVGDMTRQYRMLDAAVQSLLNFSDATAVEPTVLSSIRERHQSLDIAPQHYDAFGQALIDVLRDRAAEPQDVLLAWETTIRPGLQYMKSRGERRSISDVVELATQPPGAEALKESAG